MINKIGIVLNNEMFEGSLSVKFVLQPVAKTKDVYFRIRELNTLHLEKRDYSKDIKNSNIKKCQYQKDSQNFLTKFHIRYSKPQDTYLYDLLHIAKHLGISKDENYKIVNLMILNHPEYKLTDVGFRVEDD